MRGQGAAYGGPGWEQRTQSMEEDIGEVWAPCRVRTEWRDLRAVLLHCPGSELERDNLPRDPEKVLMTEHPHVGVLRGEFFKLTTKYRRLGVEVFHVNANLVGDRVPPNQMFSADLFFMTPSGAILGRPASPVRAGEERWVARALSYAGIPILRSVSGRATFEGSDALWVTGRQVLLGWGFRTNHAGFRQLREGLGGLGVGVVGYELPPGAMHLMGEVRILDEDLVFVRRRTKSWLIGWLEDYEYEVRFFPSEDECRMMAHNVVTLGPREVLMPADQPRTRQAFEQAGVHCVEIPLSELPKASGGIACATGVLWRG